MKRFTERVLEVIFLFLSLLMLQILFVAIQPFPGGVPPYCNDPFSIRFFAKSVLFYLAFWAFFLFVLCGRSPRKKTEVLKLIGAIAIQGGILCIRVCTPLKNSTVFLWLNELLLPVQWFSILVLFQRLDNTCRFHRASFVGVLFLTFLWLPISIGVDHAALAKVNSLHMSYYEASNVVNAITKNSVFLYGIKYAFSESAYGTACYFLGEKESLERKERRVSKRTAQFFLSGLFSLTAFLVCLFAVPNGCVISASQTKQDSFKQSGINFSTQIVKICRFDADHLMEDVVFCKTKCCIRHDAEIISRFSVDGSFPAIQSAHTGDLTSFFDNCLMISKNESEVGLFCNHMITIATAESVRTIPIESLKEQPFDESIQALCRKTVEDNLFSAFPYNVQYLMIWDSDFVIPYLRDYVIMDDPLYETIKEYGIRPEYVKEEAHKLLYW